MVRGNSQKIESVLSRSVARVFPRRTKASPTDDLAFFGPPPLICPPQVEEVHVSVAFTWDWERAEWLARQWEQVAPVKIGGPATGMRGEEFVPSRYLKPGYVITSRGCPNRCWFCSVWKREGDTRELPITEGFDVLDDNLLACSKGHIEAVFVMLSRQKERARFTGGIEAKRLEAWHLELFSMLKPSPLLFLAYDTADDLDPLERASEMFRTIGFTRHNLRCYVLIGYPDDTLTEAEMRLRKTIKLGLLPMAMLYRDEKWERPREWKTFQRSWVRPHAIGRMACP